ncbi:MULTISPECIES: phosphotransferase [Nocardiopsis]|uniref:Phosphotransferase n=1 Tax=Nocardiopsis lambiniae TaxID=3075539 RepID=A0ABU2MD31_9ACTN|nr:MULTISPECIES: phosphotransferase [unclassified Nocardiopsis]MDE3720420.1 phosphotransferase [Nocardiopsis sp. N85]MDT0330578.1 phosphotransferase [Nocardiopsis sp. DSM 44743]
MREPLTDLHEDRVGEALGAWGIRPAAFTHLPVGFADHHWSVTDTSGRRWFATVADLAHKAYLGPTPAAARERLAAAMDTAARLHDEAGLGFVVAPLRTPEGRTIRAVGRDRVLSVFPYVEGASGGFGRHASPYLRGLLLDTLARLHRRTPPRSAALSPPAIAHRFHLDTVLEEPSRMGAGGPFAEPVAHLLAEHTKRVRARLEEYDRRAAELAGAPVVVTHGEPHPGNVVWRGPNPLLVDWDTVGLAVPERDLWLVVEDDADLERYADASGHTVDPARLELYRSRWDLQDVAEFTEAFARPHIRDRDTEEAWHALVEIVDRL